MLDNMFMYLFCVSILLNLFMYYLMTKTDDILQHTIESLYEIARGQSTIHYNEEDGTLVIRHGNSD